MTTHTPGPWTVRASVNGPYVARTSGSLGDAALAKVLKVSGKGRMLEREQEQLANAQLIAAAPKLLAALRVLLGTSECSCITATCDENCTHEIARRAIAEAEGQS